MTGRDRIVVVIAVCVAAVVGSWMLVIQPKRDQAAKLGDKVQAAQGTLDSARSQVSAGQAAKRSFPRDYATIARLGEAVPPDDNVPSLIYQLQHAAGATGIDFHALQLQNSSSSSSTAAAGAAAATGAALPPGATVGSAGFPLLPFTFTFQGNFFHLADFVARLQSFVAPGSQGVSVSGRLLSLNGISLGPSSQGFPHIKATLAASAYVLPSSETLQAGATPSGPAPSTSAPASSGATPVPTPSAAIPAPR